jgi:hypothetical protein
MGMGLSVINHDKKIFLRKFRWMMTVSATSGNRFSIDHEKGSPCMISSRPKLSFDDHEAHHIQETVNYHGRPKWDPVEITLYSVSGDTYAYQWLLRHYNPEEAGSGFWGYRNDVVVDMRLVLYDGVGNIVESWIMQQAYIQSIDFGDLDHASTEILHTQITVKYIRAFMETSAQPASTNGGVIV